MSSDFYQNAYCFDKSIWDLARNGVIANHRVDPRILRNREVYLDGDIRSLWVQWFLEGLLDPVAFLKKNSNPTLIDVLAEVDRLIKPFFNSPPNPLWPSTRNDLAIAIHERLKKVASGLSSRKKFTKAEKETLILAAGGDPRCWVCGAKFENVQVEYFLGKSSTPPSLPLYVDIMKPRGLNQRHLQIEIDHVFPIAQGGAHHLSNFRLCCGWCNIHKKDRLSLYDVPGQPIQLRHGNATNNTGIRTIPQFFWTVRTLGLIGKCEYDNCTATTKTHELTLACIEQQGAATPSNLYVVCASHDPIVSTRLQPSADIGFAISSR